MNFMKRSNKDISKLLLVVLMVCGMRASVGIEATAGDSNSFIAVYSRIQNDGDIAEDTVDIGVVAFDGCASKYLYGLKDITSLPGSGKPGNIAGDLTVKDVLMAVIRIKKADVKGLGLSADDDKIVDLNSKAGDFVSKLINSNAKYEIVATEKKALESVKFDIDETNRLTISDSSAFTLSLLNFKNKGKKLYGADLKEETDSTKQLISTSFKITTGETTAKDKDSKLLIKDLKVQSIEFEGTSISNAGIASVGHANARAFIKAINDFDPKKADSSSSGSDSGTKPMSGWVIAAIILAVLFVVGVVVFIVMKQRSK
eukprot:GAHX01001354.1.p1 GENE.GAHX01001354.1~~GAHX01001354.1.p1  ORF type:complete len:315 (-),score=64.19 GAHX01001354.1:1116-2060(-)